MGFLSEYREISQLLKKKHPVVLYAESRHYYPYFESFLAGLLKNTDQRVCYITSDKKDPLLRQAPPGVQVIYCKWLLGYLFRQIKADRMLMTMTDLGNFFLKRSAGVKEYIYVFHAAVSTHQQYRKHAFDHYDTIFCTGQYQADEIRSAEKLYNLPPKQLVSYGYPLITKLQQQSTIKQDEEDLEILVAPSWFPGCIFDTCINELVQELAKLPYRVRVRSHPEYEKRYPAKFRQINKMIQGLSNIQLDSTPNVFESLIAADILITDRSGIAFEFAFGIGRPVLFIETALKQTNPDWRDIKIEPVENRYRKDMGISMDLGKIDQLPEKISELRNSTAGFRQKINALGETLFYNTKGDDQAGVTWILDGIQQG